MKRWEHIVEGALGGIIAGSAIGLVELAWLWRDGVDLSALPWAWGLYGAVGLVPGALIGGTVAVVAKLGPRVRAMAFPGGAAVVLVVLASVVGRYVLNRDVFSEAMPLWATALLVVGALGLGLGLVAAVPIALKRVGAAIVGGCWLVGFVLAVLLGWLGAPGLDVASWSAPPGASPPDKLADAPDVLVILVDTFRADHLDHPEIDTPALDALRADAVTFDQAYSPASWTRPGVASLWTSRLPTSHTADTKGSRLPEGVVTWSERLQAEGVRTGALINNINVTAGFGFDQGYDTFVYEAPAYPLGATEGAFNLALYKVVHRLEERLSGGGSVERYYQPADVVLGHASQWMRAQGEARFALFAHLMEPHDPYFDESGDGYARANNQHPDPTEEAELRARYATEVERLDRHLGVFFDELRAEGRYDDLLIVLTSDHGEEFHEHGGWWHGSALYGEQTQVPLVVKLPGNAFAGQRAPWQVRILDVPPTLTAQLGVAPDPEWEGRDLFEASVVERLMPPPAPPPPAAPDTPSHADADADADADAEGEAGVEADMRAPREAEEAPVPAEDPALACVRQRGDPLDRTVVLELDFEGNISAGVRTRGLSWYRSEPGGTRALPAEVLYDVSADPRETRDLLGAGESVCSRFPEDWASDLQLALDAERAAGGDVQGSDVEISDSERQRLCALGYLSGPECD